MAKLPEFTSVATKPLHASIGAAQSALAGVQVLYPKVEAQLTAQVAELATKGKSLVAKLRDDSISGDVEILRDDADVEAAAAAAAERAEAAAKVVKND